jgi:hypothetical protein
LDDDKRACQDSATVNEKIASRRSFYIMIMAPIITVGMIGIGASRRKRIQEVAGRSRQPVEARDH